MTERRGDTLLFHTPPVIAAQAAVGGKKESDGPLAAGFDELTTDNRLGQCSWEAAEKQLQLLFGGLPAALSQPVVGGQFVKARRQRTIALFFAANRRLCGDDRRGVEQQGIAPTLCHKKFLPFCKKCPGTCYTVAAALQYPAGLFRIIRQKPPAATAPHRTPPPPACRTR